MLSKIRSRLSRESDLSSISEIAIESSASRASSKPIEMKVLCRTFLTDHTTACRPRQNANTQVSCPIFHQMEEVRRAPLGRRSMWWKVLKPPCGDGCGDRERRDDRTRKDGCSVSWHAAPSQGGGCKVHKWQRSRRCSQTGTNKALLCWIQNLHFVSGPFPSLLPSIHTHKNSYDLHTHTHFATSAPAFFHLPTWVRVSFHFTGFVTQAV